MSTVNPTSLSIEVDPSLGIEAFDYLVLAAIRTAEEFGAEPFPTPLRVGRASSPDVPPQQLPNRIIVTMNADPDQVRLQLGHEVFHWICTPAYLHHWVHEMFAMEMSIRHLRANGCSVYADLCEADFHQGATGFSIDRMLDESISPPYPSGLHDRAYAVGKELINVIRWDRLKPLACMFDEDAQPDLAGWLERLTVAERLAVRRILSL